MALRKKEKVAKVEVNYVDERDGGGGRTGLIGADTRHNGKRGPRDKFALIRVQYCPIPSVNILADSTQNRFISITKASPV